MIAFTTFQSYISLKPFSQQKSMLSFIIALLGNSRYLTRVLLIWIAGAVLVYLIAIYSLFGLSVTIQKKVTTVKELTEINTITALNLQQKHTEFARNNQDFLKSMEKIADLRYILPTDTSLSRADISHPTSQ